MSNDLDPTYHAQSQPRLSRRTLLGLLGGAGAAGLLGVRGLGGSTGTGPIGAAGGTTSTTNAAALLESTARHAGPMGQRTLVLLELAGGNDGTATIPPIGDGLYQDIRGAYGFQDKEPVLLDDGIHAWNPNLDQLQPYGLAGLLGLGITNNTGSHFEMEQRWWAGDDAGDQYYRTGFLGRLCDELSSGELVTGVSLSDVQSRALIAENAVTLSLPDPWRAWFLQENEGWFRNMRLAIAEMGAATSGEHDLLVASRSGLTDALAFGELLSEIDTEENTYPTTDLGRRLAIAAELVERDAGVRIIHVPLGGFDTHAGQQWEHDYLMMEIGDALSAFLADLDGIGRAQDVLVATTSEFGRRPALNEGGTDHGNASVAFLAGAPVVAGLHGERSLLSDLDGDDNLKPTVSMDEYYATIAECWFGVPSNEVLPSRVEPIRELLRV